MKKIFLYNEIDQLIEEMSWFTGQNIGITGLHGNPIHSGHVDLIKGSASKCDMLIVAVNSDEICIKKSGYSFMSWKDRTAILEQFYPIDWIIENPYPIMVELLDTLPVSLYLKGGDVTEETLLKEEKDSCKEKNIKIIYGVGGNKSQSSSVLLENYYKYRRSNHEFTDCLEKLKNI